jgi:hypothetical protein
VESNAHFLNKFIDVGTPVRYTTFAGLALSPPPQKEVLWEAQNVETWRREFDITLSEKRLFVLSNDDYLVKGSWNMLEYAQVLLIGGNGMRRWIFFVL